MPGVRRAELVVAAANPFLTGASGARAARRAARLRPERHVWVRADGAPAGGDLAVVLSALSGEGVERLRVAEERSPDGIALAVGGGAPSAWRSRAEFDAGARRWTITWREGPATGISPIADDLDRARAELDAAVASALEAAPADAREHRVLLTARATLRGEASPSASPIRRLRRALHGEAPAAPAATAVAGGELPAAYPEAARRLFRAAVESELDLPAAGAARGAALNAL